MSLVAYGNSDSEEEIEDQNEAVSSSTASTFEITEGGSEEKTEELVSSSSSLIPKKQRETVKITIPSLQQFKDEEASPEQPKKPMYKSGSGLFSMLPPPKYSGSSVTHNFKPHVLTKQKDAKRLAPTVTKKVVNQATTSNATPSEFDPDSTNTLVNATLDQDEGSSSPKFDFFSLDSTNTVDSESKDEITGLPCTKSELFSSLPDPVQNSSMYVLPEQNSLPSSSYEEASTSNMDDTEDYYPPINETSDEQSFLNDKEFLKITGKRGREEINFIDVHGADQLTGKEEWLMKSLTEERVERPSKKRHGMPTQQQKRKHQITYLAFQAKERELDLKNQWAMNSLTRRETQAKYGF